MSAAAACYIQAIDPTHQAGVKSERCVGYGAAAGADFEGTAKSVRFLTQAGAVTRGHDSLRDNRRHPRKQWVVDDGCLYIGGVNRSPECCA